MALNEHVSIDLTVWAFEARKDGSLLAHRTTQTFCGAAIADTHCGMIERTFLLLAHHHRGIVGLKEELHNTRIAVCEDCFKTHPPVTPKHQEKP